MDELETVWLRESCGNGREESLHLDLTMSAQAGGDAVEVAIVIAGMTDELKGAVGGHGVEDLGEGGGVEIAGGRDSDGAVGGKDGLVCELKMMSERGAETIKNIDLEATFQIGVRQALRECGLKGIANGLDAGTFKNTEERPRDPGEEVSMLVGVDVGDRDTGMSESVDLSLSLGFNLFCTNAAAKKCLHEVD